MSKIIIHICDTLYTFRLSFSGIPFLENTLSKKEEKDFYDLEIPSFDEDRKNLKNDRDAISNDLVKAVGEKSHLISA